MENSKHIDALRTVLEFVDSSRQIDKTAELEEAAQILTDYLNNFN